MADKKTEKLAQFYQACHQKGYTDMTDAQQSLKAKVIAADLGLKYGSDIVEFFERAKACSETVEAEKREAEAQAEAERQRLSVPGKLVAALSDQYDDMDKGQCINVYRRPDGSIYSLIGHKRYEEAPSISVNAGGTLLQTYHPSQLVYTGATVGGITTGGFHETKPSVSSSVRNTGTGYITVKLSNQEFTLRQILFPPEIREAFKRHTHASLFNRSGITYCYDTYHHNDNYAKQAAMYSISKNGLQGQNYTSAMNMMSMAVDQERLPRAACLSISELLNDVISGNVPESEEQAYERAAALADSDSKQRIEAAIQVFNSLGAFRDAKAQAEKAQRKLDDIIQAEKEAAVLERERQKAKRAEMLQKLRKTAKFTIPAAVILIVVIVLLAVSAKRRSDYAAATALAEEHRYQEAVEAFAALGKYQDSAELAEKGVPYQKAVYILDCAEAHDFSLELDKPERGASSGAHPNSTTAMAAPADTPGTSTGNAKYVSRKAITEADRVVSDTEKYCDAAVSILSTLGDYRDSAAQTARAERLLARAKEDATEARYQVAGELLDAQQYAEAIDLLEEIPDYKDSAALREQGAADLETAENEPGYQMLLAKLKDGEWKTESGVSTILNALSSGDIPVSPDYRDMPVILSELSAFSHAIRELMRNHVEPMIAFALSDRQYLIMEEENRRYYGVLNDILGDWRFSDGEAQTVSMRGNDSSKYFDVTDLSISFQEHKLLLATPEGYSLTFVLDVRLIAENGYRWSCTSYVGGDFTLELGEQKTLRISLLTKDGDTLTAEYERKDG